MLNNGSHRPAITVSLAVHMHSRSKFCPKNGFAPLRWKRRVINVPLSNKWKGYFHKNHGSILVGNETHPINFDNWLDQYHDHCFKYNKQVYKHMNRDKKYKKIMDSLLLLNR